MQTLLDNLRSGRPVIAAELRPPRAELETAASMDAWIDTYHAVRGLTRAGTFVFLTDSAVGSKKRTTSATSSSIWGATCRGPAWCLS